MRINKIPILLALLFVVTAAVAAASPQDSYPLITRDTAWTVLQNDYITKYVDYKFGYINDSYYRVDWKWNDAYAKEILTNCVIPERTSQHECFRNVTEEHIILAFGMLERKERPVIYRINFSEQCLELNGEESLKCIKDTSVEVPVLKEFEPAKVSKWPTPVSYVNLSEKCGSPNGEGNKQCRKNVAASIFDNFGYTMNDFTEQFLPEKSLAELRSDIGVLKSLDMPKEVVRGNAEFVGIINPLNGNNGSFYIKMGDGFHNSNGLRIKWGLRSVLAEFNNSKTAENLTFLNYIKGNPSPENDQLELHSALRYLKLPKGAVVTNATLLLTGFRSSHNFTLHNTFRVSTGGNGAHAEPVVDVALNYVYVPTRFNNVLALNFTNFTFAWNVTLDSDIDSIAFDNQFVYACFGGAYQNKIAKINITNGTVALTSAAGLCSTSVTYGSNGAESKKIATNMSEDFLYSVNSSGSNPLERWLLKISKADLTIVAAVQLNTGGNLMPQLCEQGNKAVVVITNFTGAYDKSNLAPIWNTSTVHDPGVRANYGCIADSERVITSTEVFQSRRSYNLSNGSLLALESSGLAGAVNKGCGSQWESCNYFFLAAALDNKTSLATLDFPSYIGYPFGPTPTLVTGETVSGVATGWGTDAGDWNISKWIREFPTNFTITSSETNNVTYHNSSLENIATIDLNSSAISNWLTRCESEWCNIPLNFSTNSSGILQYSNINIVYNVNPLFTINTTDDSNSTSTTDRGSYVTFTANISDIDNDNVTFLICDSSGRSGIGCLYTEYCRDGFEVAGVKSCQFNTTNLASVEYNWTSFACDNSSACVSGVNGTFYITRPRNPEMYANGTKIWNSSGLFNGPVTVENFDDELRNGLSACQEVNGSCNVSLTFYSDSKGKLEVSLINIQYKDYDTSPPNVYSITVEPNPVLRNSSMNVTVNATDNVNLTKITATHKEGSVNLTYNAALGLWKGTLISPSTIGNYQLNITAIDSSNLTTINSTGGSGTSNSSSNSSCSGVCVQSGDGNNAELLIDSAEISYLPLAPTEKSNIIINTTVYNFGQGAAYNFKVQLKIDDVHQTNRTISLEPLNSTILQFSWNATVGNHTIVIAADYTNLIAEENGTNNNGTINVSVLDITPPTISAVITKRGSLNLQINITDNQNISSAVAIVNGTALALTYNQTSGYYEGSSSSIGAGTYPMTIKVTDVSGLTTTSQSSITVYPDPVDLAIGQGDLWLSNPSPSDKEVVSVYARTYNRGTNASGNFRVEFLLDNISQANNTVSVAGDSNSTTQFNWTAVYGNHTVTIRVDANSTISEVNESNNQVSRNINVSDTVPPTINQLTLPEIVYAAGLLTLKVNVTDNVNVNNVTASLNSSQILFAFNSTSKLYENVSGVVAPAAGTYTLQVNATDTNSLASSLREDLVVYGTSADLTASVGDIILSPDNVSENNVFSINVTVYNRGGTDASGFKVELIIDSSSKSNNTHSVHKASKNVTQLSWTAVYGPHNLTIKLDSDNIVAESNESNNVKNRTFFVLDVTPPPPVTLIAAPSNWTSQATINVSWTAVSDANGINNYEYMVDDGSWVSAGLNTSFVMPSLAEGIHAAYVRAVDKPGNVGNASNVSLYIDRSPPNAPVIKELHSGGNWTKHDTAYLSWVDPGDFGSGVTNFTVSIDGGAEIGAGKNLSYHSSNLTSGVHTLRVRAYDALNQVSNWSNNVTVYIDTSLPSAPTVTSPTHPDSNIWYANNMPIFNITPPPDNSEILGYYYIFDTVPNTTPDVLSLWTTNATVNISSGGGMAQLNGTNSSGVANGEWYLHVIAQDNTGNIGTQVAHYNIKVNVSTPVINVTDLKELYTNLSVKVFEFAISNGGSTNVSVNWTADFGDGNVTNSIANANLSPNEKMFGYVQHSYPAQGKYVIKVTAQTSNILATSSRPAEVEYLGVSNFSVINTNGTLRTFETYVRNYMAVNMTNVSWSLNTGNGVISSLIPITLKPQEQTLVFVRHNYTSVGTFAVNFTAVNSSWNDLEALNVTIA